jgi:hypothetical protein
MLYREKAGRRRGTVVVFLVLSLVVLLGVVGLTADGGARLAERRHAQATADVAALAAATDLFESWPAHQGTADEGHDPDGTAAAAARKVANDNGFTDVTVHVSPDNYEGGPHAGTQLPPGYAEVIVKSSVLRTFSNVLGSGDLPVQARSVAAGAWIYAPPVWVGDRSADLAFWMGNGGGNVAIGQTQTAVNPYGGRVIVNSSSALGAVNAAQGTISAVDFFFGGGSAGTFSGNVHNNQRPVPDPLSFLPTPSQIGAIKVAVSSPSASQTLDPGIYVGGISVGSGLSSANLTLNPGLYYMQGGGFKFQGSGTLKVNKVNPNDGVVIYNAPTNDSQDVVLLKGNGSWTLSPQATGPFAGLVIYQDRNSAAKVTLWHLGTDNAPPYANITGAVYAPNAWVYAQHKGGDTSLGSQFICRTFGLAGSGDITIPGNFVRQRTLGGVE